MGNARPAPSALAAATIARDVPPAPAASAASLNILHILRAPVGGLFRHVIDLVQGQAARGHRVGLFLDSLTGGARAEAVIAGLAPHLALGIERVAIPRQLNPRDLPALQRLMRRIAVTAPDVLHGHGAKGAALTRLVPNGGRAIRVCTPHGGTLVYSPGTLGGSFYRSLERIMNFRTDLFLFESSFAAQSFRATVAAPRGMVRIVRNGVGPGEFEPVTPNADATDFICIGELRDVKGFDILIDALAVLNSAGRRATVTIAGEGPDREALRAQAERAGLGDAVRLIGFRPAREVFAMGRMLVLSSRGESLPYAVLEAAAAGVPVIATAVGGVPEIFGDDADRLVRPQDTAGLAAALATALAEPALVQAVAQRMRTRVRNEFSLSTMVDGGLAAYREALALRKLAQFT